MCLGQEKEKNEQIYFLSTSVQKFFSLDDFTWSKELSDRWTFLKQNFCHKKPKVAKHQESKQM